MTQTTTAAPRINIRRKPAPAPAVEAKPARKAVSAKLDTKPAAKSVISHAVGAAVKFFVFVEGARPVSGIRLVAHTDAALRFTGMAQMEPVRKNAAQAIMGSRAVKYHLEQGNLEEKAGSVKLTRQGYQFFKARVEEGKIDGKLSAAFLAAITSGKTNAEAGIKEHHLIPVGFPSLR